MIGAALLYFGVRGLTEGSASDAITHGYRVLHFEQGLGFAVEETVQNAVLASRVLTTLANWAYIWLHWPVIVLTLIWLHRRHRREYLLLRNAMFVSGAIGLVIFALYPVAPPRHLPDRFVDTVTELSNSYRVLQPPQLINEYAAVPSLHVGWNLLVGIFLFRYGRHLAVRVFGLVSPVLMALAVVATANHYVIDGLVGSAIALAGLAGSYILWRFAYARRQPQVVEDQAVDAPPGELLGPRPVGDGPGEHGTEGAQLGDERGGEEPFVHHHTVRPRR